ncbi:MAG TPA: class B sortase [Bacilli bacterium]|nr:class B sortase [Bacilli bacterium]
MNKIKWKNIFILFLFLIFIIGLIISIYKIIIWKLDDDSINNQINKIYDKVNINDIDDSDKVDIIDNSINSKDPYWDYIKVKLIDVNLDKLKSINKSTVGWIKVNGTNINYPFVQSSDNKYYLTHSFNKSYNSGGWVFLDYRNDIINLDKNNIIYAHGRLNKTMFGSLKNIIKSNWYNNKDNHIIRLSSKYHSTLWQVFSIYIINNTNDYIQVSFNNDTEYNNFLNKIKNRSTYNFNTNINVKDKILTLSTCYSNNKKVVMHAKLIKIYVK